MNSEFEQKDETFWRQLEELSMMYIADTIRSATPRTSELTRERKDGGYDGKIIINISENGDIVHTVMMEAKFRTSIKSLPLQDCSKSLIIAFNRAVQTLFIVTNVLFSQQALEEIEKFEKKINLRVNKVDGYKLKQFVQKANLKPDKTFSADFLNYINNYSPEKTDLTIELGDHNRRTPNSGKPDHTIINSLQKPYKNETFNDLLKRAVKQAAKGHPMFIIQGVAGVGKTIFLKQLQQVLLKKKKTVHMIDIQLCGSPRVLLMKILEALWGSELSSIFTSDDPEHIRLELEELIGCLSDGVLDDKILGAVVQAICMDQSALQGHTDMYFYYLSEFIYKLVVPYDQQNTFLFAFYNLNKAEIDTFNFLYTLICKIHSVVTVIIEFRTPFFLESDDKKLLSSENYYNKFVNVTSDLYFVDIAPLEKTDVLQFTKALRLDLSLEQIELVVNRLGTVPLYLMLGLSFLKNQLDEYQIKAAELTDSQMDHILMDFLGAGNNILKTIISYYKQDAIMSDCFEAAVLLDGELPFTVLECLCKTDYEPIVEQLESTTLFIVNARCVMIRHNLIFDSLKRLSSGAAKARIAAAMIDGYEKGCFSFKNRRIKLFELDFYAGNYKKVLEEIESLSHFLLKEHEYYSVIKYNDLALQAMDQLEFTKRSNMKQAHILITILFSYTQLHIFGTQDVKRKMMMLETILNLNKYDEAYDTVRVWFLWIKWYIDFYSGEIKQSYRTILEAKTAIDEASQFDDQLCGQVYWSYGLSHKRLTTLQQGISDFKEGLEKYPDCILLTNAVTVHEAHQFLRTDPQKTYQMCSELVKLIENTDCFYNEVIQARVDMAMAAFYSGDYKCSLREAGRDYEIARANNISFQEGRTMNIVAANELMSGDVETALLDFKRAWLIFKESGNHLFMWRPSFNIGQIYYKSGKVEKALKHYRNFLENEIINVQERKGELTLMNCEMVCILYIARIFRENGRYKEAETIRKTYDNACFNQYFDLDNETFVAKLSELSYMHKGYIIILG